MEMVARFTPAGPTELQMKLPSSAFSQVSVCQYVAMVPTVSSCKNTAMEAFSGISNQQATNDFSNNRRFVIWLPVSVASYTAVSYHSYRAESVPRTVKSHGFLPVRREQRETECSMWDTCRMHLAKCEDGETF